MKSRLPFLLLGLVLFSTALLSILAARSLRQEALQAQRYLEEQARHTARAVSQAVADRLAAELDHVRNTMGDTVAARGDLHLIESLASRIMSSRPLVEQVYLYMNPWGLIWPTETALSPADTLQRQTLLSSLRSLAATVGPGEPVAFMLDGIPHLFAALEGRRGFFVGCALAAPEVAAVVERAVRDADGGGLVLGAEGGGIRVVPATPMESVTLRDSLGVERDLGAGRPGQAPQPLLTRSLERPLESVRVFVYALDPEAVNRTVAVRTQLYGWGIVMLALGIVGGVLWLLLGSRAEVRRARAGSEFAIGVSHDLRTPLASMRVMTESLYLGHVSDPARQQEFLRTILAECERLSQLTERVLYLFRFGQDAVHYRFQFGDPAAVARAAVEAFRLRFVAEPDSVGRPDVRLQADASVPPVRLDVSALTQVFMNLLDNAVKYGARDLPLGARGRMPIDVTVRAVRRARRPGWPQRDWVAITVRDYGPGLTPGEGRCVFRRYYRVNAARQTHVAGLGLGLTVCQHAARRHGGWMALEREPGEGCAFTCYLPVSPPGAAGSEEVR